MDSFQSENIEITAEIGADEAKNKNDEGMGIYLPYDPIEFTLQHLYRPQNDIVGAKIARAGMEGIDRYEISKQLGINANCKAGNRIVSNSIHVAKSAYPNLIGEYQKMDGKFRVKKYYLKGAENVPAGGKTFSEYTSRFKDITGMNCPYKLGEMLKFPGQNLNTLRITDTTLKRLVQVLEFVYQQKAIVTHQKIGNLITAKEHEEGYKYTIDRRSVKKLVLALMKHRLLNVMSLEVQEHNQIHRVEVITIPTIASIDDPNIANAYEKIVSEYKEGNKSFPSGHQLKRENVKAELQTEMEEGKMEQNEDFGIIQEQQESSSNVQSSSSLLHNAFITLDRIQFKQKYGKKGHPSIELLSQKSLNSLVESIKRRKKAAGNVKRQKKVKKETEDVNNTDSNPTTSNTMQTITAEREHKLKRRQQAYSVRLIDNVDKVSVQHKAYLRSRFTQRERDMLLLIRACSSFLNPINRFWPHPKVLRNLMHEFVPESRTKTTYSLMAAGVRELKDRMPQQQYLVKTMASYPELLNLRNQIGEMNFMQKSGAEEDDLRQKDYFFVDAFRKAYQLLFKETDNFPSINASDFDFGSYIHMNNLHFVQVSNTKNGSIPLRCQKPEDKKAIRASVTYNAIMSIMHVENNKLAANIDAPPELDVTANSNLELDSMDDSNFLIEQIELMQLSEAIGQLRSDGLITKKRNYIIKTEVQNEEEENYAEREELKLDDESEQEPIRKVAHLTQFYQHYFDSLFHKNLSRNIIGSAMKLMDNSNMETFGEFEDPGQFSILANQICNDKMKSIKFTTPDSLKGLFILDKKEVDLENDYQNAGPSTSMGKVNDEEDLNLNLRPTKQLRYLENSELCLGRLKINVENLDIGKIFFDTILELPEPTQLIYTMEKRIPKEKMESNESAENDNVFDDKQKKIFDAIEQAGVMGASVDELMMTGIENLDELQNQLKQLIDSLDIFACGVDKRRYVTIRNGREWLLQNKNGDGFIIKPWSHPNGETNWKILSWMLEGIFSYIYSCPGLLLNDLIAHFSLVLQPSMILEILEILQKIGCCTLQTKQIHSLRKTSPFAANIIRMEEIKLILPNPNGMERLMLFNNFKLSQNEIPSSSAIG